MLWKLPVLRMPPFHQPSYGPPDAIVAPGLPSAGEPLVHVRAERLQAENQQRIEVVVVRIALRRRPDDGPGRPALVMVVENLRQPLVIEHAVDVLGLGLRRGEEVAVVVVADVLLIEPRQPGERCASPDPALRMYQSATRSLPSGLACTNRMMHSSRKRSVSSSVAADHLVDHLAELLRAERLGRVQPAVDPDHRLALPAPARAPASSVRPFGEREPPRDVLVRRQVACGSPAR